MNRTDSNRAPRLPPTTDALLEDNERPYFLWWTDATVGCFKELIRSGGTLSGTIGLCLLMRAASVIRYSELAQAGTLSWMKNKRATRYGDSVDARGRSS
jgi:hypothetical protein